MSWIRYDDQFYGNPKVTAVIADDPAALSLHVLANTWSNGQKRPGFIPPHQPTVLILDRERAAAWTTLLVEHGLWHDVKTMCDDCLAEYGDLAGGTGYVFHDHAKYRAPARERTTPGTPTDLSEKRRTAGRRGGVASGMSRQNGHNAQANEANGVSKTSNAGELPGFSSPDRVSPVPVPEELKEKDSLKRADIGTDEDPDFTAFWDAYPRAGSAGTKAGKGQARTAWRKCVLTNHVDPKLIIAAAERFRDFHAEAYTEPRFICHAATWLNGERFTEGPPTGRRRERNFDF